MSLDPTNLNKRTYFVKYARIPVFSDPCIPASQRKPLYWHTLRSGILENLAPNFMYQKLSNHILTGKNC